MPDPSSRLIALPPLAFRVGVTGAAGLDDAAKERLRPRVAAVLGRVKAEIERLAANARAAAVYEPGADGKPRPSLRLISPLGAGADRLVAAEALRLGYALEVALPFAQADYEGTFPNSVAEFRTLLAEAGPRVLTLDGDAVDPILRARSYGAVGRLLVRNCDLLIAIWDDRKPPKGPGGTTDTVRFAVHTGVPVWWLHADGAHEPKLLADLLHLAQPDDAPSGEAALDAWLRQHLADTILPPVPPDPPRHGVLTRFAHWARQRLGLESDPLRVFLGEVDFRNHWIWTAHDRALGPRKRRNEPASQAPPSHPSARLSRLYQARYRSSYVFVFVLAAVALLSSVAGLAFEHAEAAPRSKMAELLMSGFTAFVGILEIAALSVIVGLVLWNLVQRWQDRYMSYRLLAELFRLQRRLATLGWSLPGVEVSGLAARSGPRWVGWYFAATVRSTALPAGVLGGDRLREAQRAADRDLLDEQIRFHRGRHAWKTTRGHTLEAGGAWLFGITLLFVTAKFFRLLPWPIHGPTPQVVLLLGLGAALLPVASAALFGIRAYEEMEQLAEQSERMVEALTTAKDRIVAIKPDRPLASQLLAAELFEVTSLMLADVNGWAQLFRMKAVGFG